MNKIYWAKVKESGDHSDKSGKKMPAMNLYPCFEEDYIEIAPLTTKLVPLGVVQCL